MKLPWEEVEREVLVKQDVGTDPKYGHKYDERPVELLLQYGIVNVNKPAGPSSHQTSAYVQEAIGISKAGHSGTLDPKVTGVLPVALGKGTRVVQALLPAGKEYVCLMHLHEAVDKKKVKQALRKSVGKIKQLPPVKSAVKRQWRERMIYYVEFMEMNKQDVLFRIGCQAGTYIRKYCTDFGKSLGVGAHMAQLIRTKAGPFTFDNMVTLQDLKDAFFYWKEGDEKLIRHCVQPVEEGIGHLGKIWVTDTTVKSLTHGRDLAVPGVARVNTKIAKKDLVAVMSLKGELVALGEASMDSETIIRSEKGICVRIKKVFMESDVYPRPPRDADES
ncbi:MAG: RNA-guided pseudouridylation complex pseudouridine synthase subunit Cbf5 [Candidatus Nanoarchaeia archaeon]